MILSSLLFAAGISMGMGMLLSSPPSISAQHIIDYELDYSYGEMAPDCFSRTLILTNGMFPGPAIVAYQGDILRVNVFNNMPDVNVTVHWHGIDQFGTPYHDGVGHVSQCGIQPLTNYTYTFQVNKAGSYIYHSHFGASNVDGEFGPLIILDSPRNMTTDPISTFDSDSATAADEQSMAISTDIDYQYDEMILVLTDFYHRNGTDIINGINSVPFVFFGDPPSLLINGKGWNCRRPDAALSLAIPTTPVQNTTANTLTLNSSATNTGNNSQVQTSAQNMQRLATEIKQGGRANSFTSTDTYNSSLAWSGEMPSTPDTYQVSNSDFHLADSLIELNQIWTKRHQHDDQCPHSPSIYTQQSLSREINSAPSYNYPSKSANGGYKTLLTDGRIPTFPDDIDLLKSGQVDFLQSSIPLMRSPDFRIQQTLDSDSNQTTPVTTQTCDMYNFTNPEQNNPKCSYPVYTVQKGKTYRLRFINIGSLSYIRFHVAHHNMTIIEVDGYGNIPWNVPTLDSSAGQRYSALVTMDQECGSYLITTTLKFRPTVASPGFAVLKYDCDPEQNSQPRTDSFSAYEPTPSTAFNQSNLKLATITDYDRSVLSHYDVKITLIQGQGILADGRLKDTVNGVGTELPTINFYNLNLFNGQQLLNSSKTLFYNIPYGANVRMVFQDDVIVNGICEHHPWHLHGYSFYKLGSGPGVFNESTDGHLLNLENPIRRDTFILYPDPAWGQDNTTGVSDVPLGPGPLGNACGWSVIQFKADNPGPWFLHCHILFHNLLGKQVIINNLPQNSSVPPTDPSLRRPWLNYDETNTSFPYSLLPTTGYPVPDSSYQLCGNTDLLFNRVPGDEVEVTPYQFEGDLKNATVTGPGNETSSMSAMNNQNMTYMFKTPGGNKSQLEEFRKRRPDLVDAILPHFV